MKISALILTFLLTIANPALAARDLNGATNGDNIDFGNQTYVDSATAFTVVAWVNNDTLSGTDTAVSNWTSSSGLGAYMIRTVTADLQVFFRTSAAQYGGTTALSLSTGTWTHVALVWDGSELRGYKDGTVGGTTYATSGNTNSANGQTDRIGSTSSSTTQYWDGKIAEVAMWRRALSADEIGILAKKFSVDCVSRASRVFYTDLIRETKEISSGTVPGTDTGTVSTHPPIIHCY